jgi:hypothetical protein
MVQEVPYQEGSSKPYAGSRFEDLTERAKALRQGCKSRGIV